MQGGLKKRLSKLYSEMNDAVGSEIIIKNDSRVLAQAKSTKKTTKVIRIVVRL